MGEGIYEITVQDTNECTLSEIFAINGLISVDVELGEDQIINLGDYATLNALVNVPFDSISNLVWTNIGEAECPTCPEQIVSPIITTTFNITVETISGCIDSDDLTIYVDKRKAIYAPTAFSPNNDGTNDIFYLFSDNNSVKNIQYFQVYSRLGQVVHSYSNFLPNDPV